MIEEMEIKMRNLLQEVCSFTLVEQSLMRSPPGVLWENA